MRMNTLFEESRNLFRVGGEEQVLHMAIYRLCMASLASVDVGMRIFWRTVTSRCVLGIENFVDFMLGRSICEGG